MNQLFASPNVNYLWKRCKPVVSTSTRSTDYYMHRSSSTTTASKNNVDKSERDPPKLVHVPAIPIFGSFHNAVPIVGPILSNYVGTPIFTPSRQLLWWKEIATKYGPFFELGLVGLGKGICQRCILVSDPYEMLKVIRSSDSNNNNNNISGLVEAQWPNVDWLARRNMQAGLDLWGRGDSWKKRRQFLQKGLLSPQSAREYLPVIVQAAETAIQKHMPVTADVTAATDDDIRTSIQNENDKRQFNTFLNRSTYEMFSRVLFGDIPNHVSNDGGGGDVVDDSLFHLSAWCIGEALKLKRDPIESLKRNIGIETRRVEKFNSNMDQVFQAGLSKVSDFRQRKNEGILTDNERRSYVATAMDRQEESDMTDSDVAQLSTLLMLGSVDTTSSILAWNLVHLALNPDIQDMLYEELSSAVAQEGSLTENILIGPTTTAVLLHSFVRETHRLSPAVFINIVKEIQSETLNLHGMDFQKGTVVAFDSYNPCMNPDLVEQPQEFRIDRWQPDSVQARVGTKREIMDHPFFAQPFSQGPRRCPGSRVANLEAISFLSQFLLHWKITFPTHIKDLSDIDTILETARMPVWPIGMSCERRS